MENVGTGNDDYAIVTHTICDECADNLDFQLGVTLKRYLDSLKIPVALVDREGMILQMNCTAQDCSGAPEPRQSEEWESKIYECAHARLPERCTHDIHCSGCTIRFAVTETYATGRDVISVPALVNSCTSSPSQPCDYLISTRMVKGVVHLVIESAEPEEAQASIISISLNPSSKTSPDSLAESSS